MQPPRRTVAGRIPTSQCVRSSVAKRLPRHFRVFLRSPTSVQVGAHWIGKHGPLREIWELSAWVRADAAVRVTRYARRPWPSLSRCSPVALTDST